MTEGVSPCSGVWVEGTCQLTMMNIPFHMPTTAHPSVHDTLCMTLFSIHPPSIAPEQATTSTSTWTFQGTLIFPSCRSCNPAGCWCQCKQATLISRPSLRPIPLILTVNFFLNSGRQVWQSHGVSHPDQHNNSWNGLAHSRMT